MSQYRDCDAVRAMQEFDEAWVSTNAGGAPELLHLRSDEGCHGLAMAAGTRSVRHPRHVPLSVDDFCADCAAAKGWGG
jgi:hypothetical protein